MIVDIIILIASLTSIIAVFYLAICTNFFEYISKNIILKEKRQQFKTMSKEDKLFYYQFDLVKEMRLVYCDMNEEDFFVYHVL